MPLVVLCGIPCSGKSKRAIDLAEECTKRGYSVQIISDESSFDIHSRDTVYSDSPKEKNLRAAMKSNVQRVLSRDTVIIMDALNYIKGYRYEVNCACKSAKTPQCTIWCNTPFSEAKEFNVVSGNRYSEKTMDALAMRFEPPDSQNRWENPLFTVLPSDPLPFDEIFSVLFNRKAPPPNQSTQSQPLAAANFLHELDRITQECVAAIVRSQQNDFVAGDKVVIPSSAEPLILMKKVALPELSRLRRQFINVFKTRGVDDLALCADTFVRFLKSSSDAFS